MKKWSSEISIGIILIVLGIIINDWWEDRDKPTIFPVIHQPSIPEPEKPRTNEPSPTNPITQLKHLHNPYSSIKVSLWLGEPGQKYFDSRHKVIIAYEVQGNSGATAYLTLLNISPKGQIIRMFSENIKMGKKYDGKLRPGEEYVKRRETLLEKGQEYFKAIVTSEPLNDWRDFITHGGATQMKFWGTGEMTVDVVD